MRALWLLLALLLSPLAQAQQGPCAPLTHERAAYVVCTLPADAALRLFLRDGGGAAYGQFDALADDLAGHGERLVFAMNAGMYHPDRAPVGLYIEAGRTLAPLSTRDGPGNFHLRPNGVFFIADGRAGLLETGAYAAAGLAPQYATQSGPMLVIDGAIHPAFDPESRSWKRRNGVGISEDGTTLYFVISDVPVSFYRFASLFRDALGCRNALFLDGGVASKLYAPGLSRNEQGIAMGPILGLALPADTP